jgi:hypothetical protein
MKTAASTDFEKRAVEALTALLGRVSVIRLKEINRAPPVHGCFAAISAHIELLGRNHTLSCAADSNGEPSHLPAALDEFQSGDSFASGTTHVLIAPRLSPQAQALCKEHRAGFLDFEGNARLSLGEAFIGMRAFPRSASGQTAADPRMPACAAVSSLARVSQRRHPEKLAGLPVPA